MPTIPEAAKAALGVDEDGRLADADMRRRITDHLMENQAFKLTMKRAAEDARASNGPSNTAAIMKYAGAKIAQERNELMVEALGHQGLGWEGDGFSESDLAAMRTMLRSKANSIEGGTSEINLNIVAKRVLALPDPKK
jgi:alkylation response protein AidB-like acyl-CoA dehydrogenase